MGQARPMPEPRQGPTFGVELHEYLDAATLLEEIRLAERLGYAAVWLGDSQLIWREMYVLLGAAATSTQHILLGSGVTNPVTRHVSVSASALVTLQELSGGRVLAGVGIGDSALSLIGEKPTSRALLERFVADVRSLATGATISTATADMHLAFGGPGKCPPMLIAASGPRMLELAGRIGDGVVITRQARVGETLDAMLARVAEGRSESGRSDVAFRTCLSASAAVHADRGFALQAVRPHVASTLRAFVHWDLSRSAREAKDRVTAAYDMYQHMIPTAAHADLVPDDVVTQFAIAGEPGECVEQAVALFDTGIDEITIRPYGVDGAPRAETMERFAREVMDPVMDRVGRKPVGGRRSTGNPTRNLEDSGGLRPS